VWNHIVPDGRISYRMFEKEHAASRKATGTRTVPVPPLSGKIAKIRSGTGTVQAGRSSEW
jgi:hypothetical protein